MPSKITNMLMVSVMMFTVISGFSYYIYHYIEVVPFAIFSIVTIILMEWFVKIDFFKEIWTLTGSVILSLLDIVVVGYVIGFIVHFIFDINLHKVLNISLIVGVVIEFINLSSNKKKYGKYFPG